MPDTGPFSVDFLMDYAKSISDGDPMALAHPTDFPDDIAQILQQLQEGGELDEDTEKDLRDAYQQWADEGFLVEVDDDEDDYYLAEGYGPGVVDPALGDLPDKPTPPQDAPDKPGNLSGSLLD